MNRGWILLPLLLVVGQPEVVVAARPRLSLNQIDISKPPLVRLYLTDLDSTLNPITDRKAQNYRLLIDGVPGGLGERLQRFHQTGEPVTLELVVQVSPAMRDGLTDAVEACKRLIDSLPRGSKVGLIAYADVVDPNLRPTAPTTAKEGVDGLRIREGIEVQVPFAVKDGLEAMDSQGLPRQKLLVVLSDGLTLDLKPEEFQGLGRRAQDKGVIVHAIGYMPLDRQGLRSLEELTKTANGTTREARDGAGVARAFAALQEEIRNQAVVSYQAPTSFDGKLHDFQIETTPSGITSANQISIELPKIAPVTEGKSVFSSTWFLVLMLALGQAGLVVLVVLAFRWHKRPVVAPRKGVDEDEEEEEGDSEEPEDEDDGHETIDRESDDDEPSEDAATGERPPRRPRPPARGLRAGREPRPPSKDLRAARGAGLLKALEMEESEEGISTGVAEKPMGPRQPRKIGALLAPNPLLERDPLFDTAPAPDDRSESQQTLEKKLAPAELPLELSETPRPQVEERDEPPRHEAPPSIPLLPDPRDFLNARGGAPPPAEPVDPVDPVRRGGAEQEDPLAGLALPNPEEFMRQVRGQPAGRVPRSETSASSRRPSREGPPAPVQARPASSAVAGSGIPLKAPEVVPAALPPEAGVEPGRFIDRKTKVIAVEELSTADYVAWIVQLAPPHLAVVVSDGFTIGSAPNCQFRLQGADVMPTHVVLRLDSRGFRAETTGSRGETLAQPLSDGNLFSVGSHELVFKVASRTAVDPLAAARLEVLDGMDMGRKVPLPEGEVISIGAHSSCRLVVRGHGVEKVHAIAVRTGQVCTISDLGSAAGVGYQGQSVGYRKIRSWEEVMIGAVRMIFILEDFGGTEPVVYGEEHQTWNERSDDTKQTE